MGEVNNILKSNIYPSNRITSGIQDTANPDYVNDIYKTEHRLIGNESNRIYGKFSPNINVYTYTNPITHRRETIRGEVNYFTGDEDRVNKALTWQKIPSHQASQESINFINRINHYGNNEQNSERIREAIRELNRKLAKKEITYEAYQAQKQLLEQQQTPHVKNDIDTVWSNQNKTSMWKMFQAIRGLEWENDYIMAQVNSCLSSQQTQTDSINQSTQLIGEAIGNFTTELNAIHEEIENLKVLL